VKLTSFSRDERSPVPRSLRANTIASYFARGWAGLIALALLPLYAAVLGSQAYALIGTFAILQAWALLFDFGLTPTLSREMARFRAGVRSLQSVADLLRSFELVGLAVALGLASLFFLSAAYLAEHWFKTSELVKPLQIMGAVVTLRWLEQIYRAALQGAQDQVWLGKAHVLMETLRWGGAYIVIVTVRADILTFFIWQGFTSLATIIILRGRVYRLLPLMGYRPQFRWQELHGVKKFAGGMFLSSLLTFVLSQADKIIVARFVPLGAFGYYMLASAAASGLLQLILPMNQSVLPRMTEYAGSKDVKLDRLFQSASKWMVVILAPPALLMAFFPKAVLLLWTGDLVAVASAAPILPLLALGMLVNGIMNMPYMLQLSHGWTSITNVTNAVAVCCIVPLAFFVVPRYGAPGAAVLFLVVNLAYFFILPGLTFKRVMPGAGATWYREAVIAPVAAASACGILLRIALGQPSTRLGALAWLMLAGAAFLAAVIWATRGEDSPASAILNLGLHRAQRRRESDQL